jgi:hypothetical protein
MAASNPERRQEFYSGRELFPERLARELFAEKQHEAKVSRISAEPSIEKQNFQSANGGCYVRCKKM